MNKANNPINVQFVKNKLMKQEDGIAFHVIMGDIRVCQDFSLCKMDEIDLIIRYTIIEIFMVDVRRKPMRL
jgi:hypothetical protein